MTIEAVLVSRLSYTSGFIEADGCFHLSNSCSIRITNKCLPVLKMFQDWWGGSVKCKSSPKNCFEWNLHAEPASDLCKKLLPFLKMKREEAEVLIEFQSTKGIRGQKLSPETIETRKDLSLKIVELRKARNNFTEEDLNV